MSDKIQCNPIKIIMTNRERLGQTDALPEYRRVYFQHLLTTALHFHLEKNQRLNTLDGIEILGVQEFHEHLLFMNRPKLCIASEIAVLNHSLYGILAKHKSSKEKPFLIGLSDQGSVLPMKQPNFFLESCGHCGDYVYRDSSNFRENVSRSMEEARKREREEKARAVEELANLFRAFEQPGVFTGNGIVKIETTLLPDTHVVLALKGDHGEIIKWHFGHK